MRHLSPHCSETTVCSTSARVNSASSAARASADCAARMDGSALTESLRPAPLKLDGIISGECRPPTQCSSSRKPDHPRGEQAVTRCLQGKQPRPLEMHRELCRGHAQRRRRWSTRASVRSCCGCCHSRTGASRGNRRAPRAGWSRRSGPTAPWRWGCWGLWWGSCCTAGCARCRRVRTAAGCGCAGRTAAWMAACAFCALCSG